MYDLLPSPWQELLIELLDEWMLESRDEDIPVALHRNYIFETLTLSRGTCRVGGGIVLSTVHAVKGMEFNHVLLCGKWSTGRGHREIEEERRVFYTGMTRAKHSLSIFMRADINNPFEAALEDRQFVHRTENSSGGISRQTGRVEYRILSLKEIFLDYAGRRPSNDELHLRLSHLSVGSRLKLAEEGESLLLQNERGGSVAALSSAGCKTWVSILGNILDIRVLAIHTRLKEDIKEPAYLKKIRVDKWEIPICEVKYRT